MLHVRCVCVARTRRSRLHTQSVLPGDERQGVLVGKKAARYNSANASVYVDVVALDDFFAAHDLEKIYYVSIDTEGFDPLVLEGMRGAISRRQVSIVEFEVNTLGFWSRKRLIQAFAVFDAARYSCFWAAAGLKGLQISTTTAFH